MNFFSTFWNNIVQVWTTGVLGTGFGAIAASIVIVLCFALTRVFIVRQILNVFRALARRTETDLDNRFIEALVQPLRFAFVLVGFSIAVHATGIYEQTDSWMGILIRSMIAGTLFWVLYNFVEPLSLVINRFLSKLDTSSTARETLRGFFVRIFKIIIFALGISAVLQEWGFNVAAVLGSLGLIGMAVALAAKDVVSNLFAGITIFFNRTFEIGNWIKTSEIEGVVEHLGLMTTKVRRFDKALIVVENRALTSQPITNFSRMTNRRIYWKIGLEYRTTQEQLKKIVAEIKKYVFENEEFETDPKRVSTFVVVDEFADSSINIMLYCFTKTTKWGEWLRIKEELALRIKETVERNKSGFAFPSSSLYVETLPFGQPETFPVAPKTRRKTRRTQKVAEQQTG